MQQEKDVNDQGFWRPRTGPWRGLGRLMGIHLALAAIAFAHPIPDIPVRAFFQADGSALFQVEIDTRCFEADPVMAPLRSAGMSPARTTLDFPEPEGPTSAMSR